MDRTATRTESNELWKVPLHLQSFSFYQDVNQEWGTHLFIITGRKHDSIVCYISNFIFLRKIRIENYVMRRETSFDLLFKHLLIMEFCFHTMMCSA